MVKSVLEDPAQRAGGITIETNSTFERRVNAEKISGRGRRTGGHHRDKLPKSGPTFLCLLLLCENPLDYAAHSKNMLKSY